MLDQSGEALDPVAVVAVKDPVDQAHLGVVDVTAHHAVSAAAAGLARDRGLEVTHVRDRSLDLELQIARQAPVRQPHAGAQHVEPPVHPQREFVGGVAQVGQPAGALDDAVEQVPMRDPQQAPVGGAVQALVQHLDTAETVLHVAARELVVIAGNVDDASALACLAQDLLNHIVVRLRPVPVLAQLPAVDDVAHQVQRLGIDPPQEVQQRRSLTARRTQMQVGDPDGPDLQRVGHGIESLGFAHFAHGR